MTLVIQTIGGRRGNQTQTFVFNLVLYPRECGYIWGRGGTGRRSHFWITISMLTFNLRLRPQLHEETGIIHGRNVGGKAMNGPLGASGASPPFTP